MLPERSGDRQLAKFAQTSTSLNTVAFRRDPTGSQQRFESNRLQEGGDQTFGYCSWITSTDVLVDQQPPSRRCVVTEPPLFEHQHHLTNVAQSSQPRLQSEPFLPSILNPNESSSRELFLNVGRILSVATRL